MIEYIYTLGSGLLAQYGIKTKNWISFKKQSNPASYYLQSKRFHSCLP